MKIRYAFPLAVVAALLAAPHFSFSSGRADSLTSSIQPASTQGNEVLLAMEAGTGNAGGPKRDLSRPSLNEEQRRRLEQALRSEMAAIEAREQATLTNSSLDPAKQAALERALQQKMKDLDAQAASPGTEAASRSADQAETARMETPRTTMNSITAGMEAPPVPLSAQQQVDLAELLALYQQDAISPREYHLKRAEIVSGN